MNFERQAVLTHELFHIIVRHNKELSDLFRDLTTDREIQQTLGTAEFDSLTSQIEELFCDFAAVWYFGPVYLQAFKDEISYYEVRPSDSHPPSDLRAGFLLANNSVFKNHQGYKSLDNYLRLRKRAGVTLPKKAILVNQIGKPFGRLLNSLELYRYSHEDVVRQVTHSFADNIPFVAKDVRRILNNIPVVTETTDKKRHLDLISESLRKTNLLRQVSEYVRDPDALFAMPYAASNKRKRAVKKVVKAAKTAVKLKTAKKAASVGTKRKKVQQQKKEA